MEVRTVEGPRGPLHNLVPTVWRADDGTICILLDHTKKDVWLIVTLDVREPLVSQPSVRLEAS